MSISKEAKAIYDRWYRKHHGNRIKTKKYIDARTTKGKAQDSLRHQRYNAKPEVKREKFIYKLWHRYNITVVEFDCMILAQNGRCAICEMPFKNNKQEPHVDHHHGSKRVRGLLCSGCNKGLGAFHEHVGNLHSAIYYLTNN